MVALVPMIDLVKGTDNNISGARCIPPKGYYSTIEIVFLCDENYKGSSYHFTSCYLPSHGNTWYKTSIDKISFNSSSKCSMPHLGTYFEGFHAVKILSLSNINLSALEQENLFGLPSMLEINLSHNNLTKIPSNVFANNLKLRVADFSFNKITVIEPYPFVVTKNLTKLDISHNFLTKLDCNVFLSLQNLQFLNVSENSFSEIDFNCIPSKQNLTINISRNSELLRNLTLISNIISLDTSGSLINQIYNADNMTNIVYLNVSQSKISNINELIRNLSSSLQSFDASFNFIGKLNHSTFDKLENLIHLSLQATNIKNIQFATFHRQRKLKTLDISYNDLNKINFTSFRYAVDGLESLYVDGNNINELDDLSAKNFPKLKWLGISKNNFNCDDLLYFLRLWSSIQLKNNNSNTKDHIDGVDCHPTDHKPFDTIEVSTVNTTIVSMFPSIKSKINNIQTNQTIIIIYLLSFMCILCFVCFLILVKFIYFKRFVNYSSSEHSVIYRNGS